MSGRYQTYCSYFDYADMPADIEQGIVPYTQGLDAVERTSVWGQDSAILAFIIVILLTAMFGMRHYRRFFSVSWRNLSNVRTRINAFDDHTIDESSTLFTLNLVACVGEAIMLMGVYQLSCAGLRATAVFVTLLSLTAMMCAYVVAQYAVYWIVGFVFTSRTMRSQWLSGFSSVQSMLGLSLIVPALTAMFYPGLTTGLVLLGAFIYLGWRMVFIVKGFRIFFHNYFSLVYFILYLCSVEIIPLLLLYRSSFTICRLLN